MVSDGHSQCHFFSSEAEELVRNEKKGVLRQSSIGFVSQAEKEYDGVIQGDEEWKKNSLGSSLKPWRKI